MKYLLIAAMLSFLLSWWKKPRANFCFLLYTLVMGIQTIASRNESMWRWIEPLALVLVIFVVTESFWWSTEFFPAPRPKLFAGLIGIAIVFSALPSNFRLMLHSGLFGFTFAGLVYFWIKPWLIAGYNFGNWILLTTWLGLRVVANGHSGNHYYQPCLAILYTMWTILSLSEFAHRVLFVVDPPYRFQSPQDEPHDL